MRKNGEIPLLLTVRGVADLTGQSVSTVYRRIESGSYKTMPDPLRKHILLLPSDQFFMDHDARVTKIRESIMVM